MSSYSNNVFIFQMGGKEERKKEIEEKLKVLNAKKHDLVQVLKQVIIQLAMY